MTAIAISSGHGLKVRGASGYLDEVNEARRVVNRVFEMYQQMGVPSAKFHDDTSTSQSQNLNTIVNWHNRQTRDLDISVHFNAYQTTNNPMGTECLYVTQADLAKRVSAANAAAGRFINRGPKYRSDLAFLNGTNKPAILIEVCFVDSRADADLYNANFEAICTAIAETTSGRTLAPPVEPPTEPPVEPPVEPPIPPTDVFPILEAAGKVSWFGGPEDTGVTPSEGLAFIYEYSQAPYLFLPQQPPGTTGLARRLDPEVNYIAMRWDYAVYPKTMLASGRHMAKVRAPSTGKEFYAWPADWGPNQNTGRVCDISQGLMDTLGIKTDDHVEVTFPSQMSPPDVRPPEPIEPPEVAETPTVVVHLASDSPVTVRVQVGSNVSLGDPEDGASA